MTFTDDGDHEEAVTSAPTASVPPLPVTIAANHETIGAGLENLVFTLTRTGETADKLEVTVALTQDEAWLAQADLSHEVTFRAGNATATLTIAARDFSLDPTASGELAATVSVGGMEGDSATVEVISVEGPPVRARLGERAYTFSEPEGDVSPGVGESDESDERVLRAVTVDIVLEVAPGLPRVGRELSVTLEGRAGTAVDGDDYNAVSLQPVFGGADFDETSDAGGLQATETVSVKLVDDEVYEGEERFKLHLAAAPGTASALLNVLALDGTVCTASFCSTDYPVTLTDEEDVPVLALSADPETIEEADDGDTPDVEENASELTVTLTNAKTFAGEQTLTLSFAGTAEAGTHYEVAPADADPDTGGHQVTLAAGAASVTVTVSAVDNATADGARTIEVTGTHDGTQFGSPVTVTIADDDVPNTAPTAADGEVTTDEDTAYEFAAGDFNFSDSDTGDTLASVTVVTLPAAGEGTLALDGVAVTADRSVAKADLDADKLVYTPPANANGEDFASFTFRVSDGTAESALAYTMTVDVTAVNDPATGQPSISGTVQVGQTLTADLTGIADVDGKTQADAGDAGYAYAYQWLHVDGGTETAIADATGATYTLTGDDAGKSVAVRVTFTDDGDHEEAVTSDEEAVDTVQPQVSNSLPTAADGEVTTDEDMAYEFAAGDFNFSDSDTGDTLASVTVVTLPGAGEGTLALDGVAVTAGRSVAKADLDADKLVYTPPANANGEDFASFTFRVSDGTAESALAYTMTVDVTAVNDPATGKPSISGTVQVGQTLTADLTGIGDVDGKTQADAGDAGYAYAYQWLHVDGGTETAIADATGATYTLIGDDAGKSVAVRVTFTDDGDHEEAVTSAPTASVPPLPVTIAANHETIGAGLENLVFTLTRTGETADKLEVTVALTQDEAWLAQADLSHEVTFRAGNATATLTIAARDFSLDPTASGELAATVSVGGMEGDSATVEVISVEGPPVRARLGERAYTFSEPEGDVSPGVGESDESDERVLRAVTVDIVLEVAPGLPRVGRELSVTLEGRAGTAVDGDDYNAVSLQPVFGGADFDETSDAGGLQATETVSVKLVDDEVYEGEERFKLHLAAAPGTASALLNVLALDGTVCTASFCSTDYPVTLTDEEDVPVLALSADPETIEEADDGDTPDVEENASELTVTLTNAKTFAGEQTLTLSFAGTAEAGTHYEVAPADADPDTGGHQVTLAAGAASVTVTVSAVDNATADGARTIEVTGTHDGTQFGSPVTVTIATAPVFDDGASTERTVAEDAAPGDAVGAPVAASDADGDVLTYRLEGADAASFEIDAATGQIQAKAGAGYDFESAKKSYQVTVRVSDGHGHGATIEVTVRVTDAVETPLAPAAPTVRIDPDSTTSLTVSWRAPDNAGRPAITHYDLRYQASGGGGWADDGPQDVEGTRATIPSLTEGQEYEVQVRAANADGDGIWSASGRGTPGVETARPGDVHLVGEDGQVVTGGDTDEAAGRLEVFHRGQWGTVCDDRFTESFLDRSTGREEENIARQLACRWMGYGTAEVVPRAELEMSVAPASQKIWLDDVRCAEGSTHGRESEPTGLHHCYHAGVGLSNCTHEEDVHLKCSDPLEETDNGAQAQAQVRSQTQSLTARFEKVPERHDGSTPFTVRLALSAPVDNADTDLRDHAVKVTGGGVDAVERIDGRSDLWQVTIEPDGTGDIEVSVEAKGSCGDPGTLCTEEGEALSETVTTTVSGPGGSAALTASFENVPEEHDGENTFEVHVVFNEPPAGMRNRDIKAALQARGGTKKHVRAIDGNPAHRRIGVKPDGPGPVTLSFDPTADCAGPHALCTAAGGRLENGIRVEIPGPVAISVADARVEEAAGAVLAFRVTLDRARTGVVSVDYATGDGTATAGSDYTAVSGTLEFVPGETARTVNVPVLDDAHDEGAETLVLRLSNPRGARIDDGEATGTITNTDAMPRAWLARLGRTVAEQVVEAAQERLRSPPLPGAEVSIAGQRIGGAAAPEDEAATEAQSQAGLESLALWLRDESDEDHARYEASSTVTDRELLTGTSFALGTGNEAGGMAGLWGRGAVSRFSGGEDTLTLDGEVSAAMFGGDFTRERWTAGLMLSHSRGEGTYQGADAGAVSSTVTGLYPYGRYLVNGRVTVWGVAGYGAGTLRLTPEGQASIETDIDLAMGALGLRGVVVEASPEGGPELAVTSDALGGWTTSAPVRGVTDGWGSLAASEADVTRLRLGLEGAWHGLALGTGSLVPRLEVGMRHDGGDAETGVGLDVGGGFGWSSLVSGLQAEVSGRGLLTHESAGFRDRGFAGSLAWDPAPGTDRGPSLTLSRTMGGSAAGGVETLLRPDTARALGAANEDDLGQRRLEAELGYGFEVLGGGWTGTPELGLGWSETVRETTLGWRLAESRRAGLVFGLDIEGARRESVAGDAAPEHRLGLGFGWRLEGAAHERFELQFEGTRREPANDDGETRLGVNLTARW